MLYIYNILIYLLIMPTNVHNRIAVMRAEKGLSRKELAAAVNVNFQTIGYLERGDFNASLELALKLAAFFEVPVEVLFSLEPITPLGDLVRAASRTGTSENE